MSETPTIHHLVRESAAKKLLFLPRAIRQRNKPDRMITATEVREVVQQIEVIEYYPEDPRGHSCLLRGEVSSDRIIHVVCSPKEGYLAIITAYIPNTTEWDDTRRVRRKGTV